MCLPAGDVGRFRVGRHLAAALGPRPAFGGAHECSSYPQPPEVGINIPAFQVSDGRGLAFHCPGANRCFDKTAKATGRPLRHEDGNEIACQASIHLSLVLLPGTVASLKLANASAACPRSNNTLPGLLCASAKAGFVLLGEHAAKIVAGLGHVGRQPHRFATMRESFVEASVQPQGHAQRIVQVGPIGPQLQSLRLIGTLVR